MSTAGDLAVVAATNTTATSTKVVPEHEHYETIERHFASSIANGRAFLFDKDAFDVELTRLWETYQVPYECLLSWIRNLHVTHVKRTTHLVKRSLPRLLDDYVQGKSIVELAVQANYPPYLLARCLVEAVATEWTGGRKKALSDAMKNPPQKLVRSVIAPKYLSSEENVPASLLRTEMDDTTPTTTATEASPTRLAREVQRAVAVDPMYGPRHDKERHTVGVEFEVVLEYKLRKMNIPFETEAQLRDKGTSRTPDILLSVPLGIEVPKRIGGEGTEWKIVSWIDSKALFGDTHTHQTSVIPQAESYVHRFGPGLILYWFGHAPVKLLEDGQGDISIVGWQLPDKFMMPTGKMLRRAR